MAMRDTGIAIAVCALAAASTRCDGRRSDEVGATACTTRPPSSTWASS